MFTFNGEQYDLPKKTMALNDKIEAVNHAKTTRDAYFKMMEFVVAGLGKEVVTHILGTANVNEVDLIELNMLADSIILAYDTKIAQNQLEQANAIVNSDAITNMIKVGDSVEKVAKFKK